VFLGFPYVPKECIPCLRDNIPQALAQFCLTEPNFWDSQEEVSLTCPHPLVFTLVPLLFWAAETITALSQPSLDTKCGRKRPLFVIAAIRATEDFRNMKRRPTSERTPQGTKTIVFLALPGSQILDITGPYQVFVRAAEIYQCMHPKEKSPYKVLLTSATRSKSIVSNCGLNLTASDTLGTIRGPVHTLLVAGGTGVEKATHDKEVVAWLRKMSPRVVRLGSICTGAFLLASAGLLDGKRAVTHWKWVEELACRSKKTTVDPEPIFIRDGNIYTSAGVLAGMDLALALVEEDLGSQIALQVARELVMYLRRAGGQSQFSTALALQASDRRQIEELRLWAVDHLTADLRVENLAVKTGMSPRNFARIFLKDTGITPARFVEKIRVEAARRRLEESKDALDKIASDCGFGSLQALRRSFTRGLRIAPSEYRKRFSDAPDSLQSN
jgi:transcriptional regulator GlxA family with amidase domain